jgi:hypothetical protein
MGDKSPTVAVLLALAFITPAAWMIDQADGQAIRRLQILTVPEDFVLTEKFTTFDHAGKLYYEMQMVIDSNGTVAFEAAYYGNVNISDPERLNVSSQLDDTYINYLRDAMNADDLCIFDGTFNDAGASFQGPKSDIDELSIETPCGNRTMRFLGNAMLGILPNTYIALDDIQTKMVYQESDPLNVTVDVTAHIDSKGILNISAVLTNNGGIDVDLVGVCGDTWPAEVVKSNGCTVARLRFDVFTSCILPVGAGETYTFNPFTWNASGLAEGTYVIAAEPSPHIGIAILDITQDLGHVNSAPRVSLNVSDPETPDNHTYTFDASECCDAEDLSPDLEVRWDWHADGNWDTEWTYNKVARHDFSDVSGYKLTIAVRDSNGLITEITVSMTEDSTTQFAFTSLLILFVVIAAAVLVTVVLVLLRKRR